ncbi:MAG: DegV family protein [Deltaproteobacteria bacterium]|nr:DegV family protein [Deltaproteobacteria bacterium]
MVGIVGVATLQNLIRGGRASWLSGWVANFLAVRPLISFVDGELKSVGRMKAKADLAAKMKEFVLESSGRHAVLAGPLAR